MKNEKMLLVIILLVLGAAHSVHAQGGPGPVGKDPNSKPVQSKPDLTVLESTWRIKPRSILITIANVGAATAGKSTGGYGCETDPNAKGISFGFAAQFLVPSLTPKQRFKVFLDCGTKARITSVGLDGGNKIDESNENNNAVSFAAVQQKTTSTEKPGVAAQEIRSLTKLRADFVPAEFCSDFSGLYLRQSQSMAASMAANSTDLRCGRRVL